MPRWQWMWRRMRRTRISLRATMRKSSRTNRIGRRWLNQVKETLCRVSRIEITWRITFKNYSFRVVARKSNPTMNSWINNQMRTYRSLDHRSNRLPNHSLSSNPIRWDSNQITIWPWIASISRRWRCSSQEKWNSLTASNNSCRLSRSVMRSHSSAPSSTRLPRTKKSYSKREEFIATLRISPHSSICVNSRVNSTRHPHLLITVPPLITWWVDSWHPISKPYVTLRSIQKAKGNSRRSTKCRWRRSHSRWENSERPSIGQYFSTLVQSWTMSRRDGHVRLVGWMNLTVLSIGRRDWIWRMDPLRISPRCKNEIKDIVGMIHLCCLLASWNITPTSRASGNTNKSTKSATMSYWLSCSW